MDAKNYEETLKSHAYVLVNFYKDKTDTEFSGARAVLEHGSYIGEKLQLAKVNVSSNADFVKQFGIDTFPTKKWFHKGTVVNFEGPIGHEDIVNQVLRKTGQLSTSVDCPTLKSTISEKHLSLVYFGDAASIMHE